MEKEQDIDIEEDFKIYRLSDEEKLEYILNNTNYLDDIDINNIKQIEADERNNVYVLFKDGKLYRNGEQQDTEIKMFDMLWGGAVLFKITKDNIIVPVDNRYRSNFERYFNNNNCKYKKILTEVFFLVALTEDGTVRAASTSPITGIVPENFFNVDDIYLKEKEDDPFIQPYILKDGKEVPLFTIF